MILFVKKINRNNLFVQLFVEKKYQFHTVLAYLTSSCYFVYKYSFSIEILQMITLVEKQNANTH